MPSTIRVFDPALCCSTGVCGPSIDPELARFAADVDWLRTQGVTVERFNLAQQPGAFAETAAVKEALARGNEVLPLVMVDDRIAVEGSYPSRQTLAALAGVVIKTEPAKATECCAPKSGTKSGCC
ncbi:Arsenical resistance operon trans-acting repressor ArsD [Labilithrix luteola]|uniref:Arsenical resistance operon trans-acting repressor ArsD n=1 Tax=Labilithrix luteola TaxID=1391654 RepID=A0A0K1PT07_9BACT|nr:arsenite efflux transporter metallochaperone ArsD [Labilithrix luteola]AKU96244.1 Arsenical resistance operon trans-acting repressor ArsD [Labilithrix luteola]